MAYCYWDAKCNICGLLVKECPINYGVETISKKLHRKLEITELKLDKLEFNHRILSWGVSLFSITALLLKIFGLI